MLNLKPPESPSPCDFPVGRSKRPRDDSDPWNVAWPSDTHRRLEVLRDNKVVTNWMNGAWEVKGDEHAVPVRNVVDRFVRWFLDGTFQPRTNDWCRHIFRKSNKAADTHANCLMDNGDSGLGAQWMAPDVHDKCKSHVILCCLSMVPEERVGLVRLLGFCGYGMNTVLVRKFLVVDVC